VSYYSAGFRTFDVSDPSSPVILDEYDTSLTSGNGFMGAFGVYPWLPSGRVLVSDWDNGVYIFEVDTGATPVAITRFDARYENGAVELRWELFADEDFSGFRVYRSRDAGRTAAIATLADPATRRFVDDDVAPGATLHYTLSALGADGREVLSPTAEVRIPGASTVLDQNHPNPFNPSTTIAWRLARGGSMSLRVFDARGRLVRTLVEGYREAGPGSARWDGRDRRGTAVASGVYFYRLTVGGERLTRRMHLVK
jgi:hypothetical protein